MSTLPGDLPGLIRRGSPVWWRDFDAPHVVTWTDGETALVAPCADCGISFQDDVGNVALDLSDPTGRTHAAWWLARWWQDKHAGGASGHPLQGTAWWYAGARSWRLSFAGCDVTFLETGVESNTPTFVEVPGLGSITEGDAALRLACLYAAGLL